MIIGGLFFDYGSDDTGYSAQLYMQGEICGLAMKPAYSEGWVTGGFDGEVDEPRFLACRHIGDLGFRRSRQDVEQKIWR
jgi:hypothetical protein